MPVPWTPAKMETEAEHVRARVACVRVVCVRVVCVRVVCVCARWPHTPPPCGMLVGTVTWRKQPKREHSERRLYDPEAGPFFPGGRRQGSGQSQGGHGERGLRLAGVCARMCSYVSTPVTRFP